MVSLLFTSRPVVVRHSYCLQGFHRPIYTTSLEGVTLASDLQVANDLRDAYEQIFFQYEVNAAAAILLSPNFIIVASLCVLNGSQCHIRINVETTRYSIADVPIVLGPGREPIKGKISRTL